LAIITNVPGIFSKKSIFTFFLCGAITLHSWAFKPDITTGCKVVAEQQSNPSSIDAIHAAYCLGVLDGITSSILKRQSDAPLPDPCFDKQRISPYKLARQVVVVLSDKPELVEMAHRSAKDRGSMAAYVALALTNQCSGTANKPK
jgi:hypothetical protein